MTDKKNMIFAHPRCVVVLHWFNAFAWIVLTITGLAIITGDTFRNLPEWYPEFFQNLVGHNGPIILSHSLFGVLWWLVYMVFTVTCWKQIVKPFLSKILSLTPRSIMADLKYTGVTIARLFGAAKNANIPPAGRYNGAQRLLSTMVLGCSFFIVASGLILFFGPMVVSMSQNPWFQEVFRWALVIHEVCVGLVWIGLISHIYYALIEIPEAMEAVKSGYLDAEFVKHHNPGWYEELKEKGEVQ